MAREDYCRLFLSRGGLMAQLVVGAAGSAAGGIARSGIARTLAGPVVDAAAGYAAGYAATLVSGPQKRRLEGPRLDSFPLQGAREGAPVTRVYGRARIPGQIIWASGFRETVSKTTQSSGGKGSNAVRTSYTEYLYSVSFAVGLCEGVIDRTGRVWADGKPFDISAVNARLYTGTKTQNPDSLIELLEGAGNAPAFRGLAYIVFENLPLKAFGNRIPQFSFEVERSLRRADENSLENILTAASIIPGSGEFVYATQTVKRQTGAGRVEAENHHTAKGLPDFVVSMDALSESAPNLEHVSLVVSWFGTSTGLSSCTLHPGVDSPDKETFPLVWEVNGVERADAYTVSSVSGRPAYGGTPADAAVIQALSFLKKRGLKVMFHPFILMDSGGYPWRGRISPGDDDGTQRAGAAVEAFFGTAAPGDFTQDGQTVRYHGPQEWSFRRFILHYAFLCRMAGGVDTFLLGSELRGVTTARDHTGAYPAVAAMKRLAADVRSVLGAQTEISYGADWSEYAGHRLPAVPGGFVFHLDPLWSDPDIDFIGIDNYMPLSDLRDDPAGTATSVSASMRTDFEADIRGGEGYDWYYAGDADRESGNRTPVTDGAYGEPWIWRYKDIWNWWSRSHHDRPDGTRSALPTGWVARSKPVVFTETGCPAVDRGANRPSAFADAKSVEDGLPPGSRGWRDDAVQRSFLEAHGAFWRKSANNPVSPLYGGTMVAADRQYAWCYDARPFPDFPARRNVWGDWSAWDRGHWLNGRLGQVPLDLLVRALVAESGFYDVECRGLDRVLSGYIVDRPMSSREMIDTLAEIYRFDCIEDGGRLRFQSRDTGVPATVDAGSLVRRNEGAFTLARAQETDIPSAFRLGFLDESAGFAPAVVEAARPGAASLREAGTDIAAVMPASQALAQAQAVLADAGMMRETLSLTLPPSLAALEPGDRIAVNGRLEEKVFRIVDIEDGIAREAELVRVSSQPYGVPPEPEVFRVPPPVPVYGPPVWELMDLPLAGQDADPFCAWFAAFSEPWPGGAALYRAPSGRDEEDPGPPAVTASLRATTGRLATPLSPMSSGRRDSRHADVLLYHGTLSSRSISDVLGGANLFAVRSADGSWELAQFENASLVSGGLWRLSGFLRGQAGTEMQALAGAPAGSAFVLLDGAVTRVPLSLSLRGLPLDWQAGPETETPGSGNFTRRTFSAVFRGATPLFPVHLKAARKGEDIEFSWIRRTRTGGDTWEGEVPVGEIYERYRVRIHNGSVSVRTTVTDCASCLYTAREQLEDFGPEGPGTHIRIGVAQLSDTHGEGVFRYATLPVMPPE